MENCRNKMGLNDYKWSTLNAPDTQNQLSHPYLELGELPFLLALWGNKNWPLSIKVREMENCQNKMGLKGCKWSSLNAQGTENHLTNPYLKLSDFPFLTISPVG